VLLTTIGATFGGYVAMLIIFVGRRHDRPVHPAPPPRPRPAARCGRHPRPDPPDARGRVHNAGPGGRGDRHPAGLLATAFVHDQLVTRGFVAATFPMTNGLLPALAAVLLTALVAVCAALIAARRLSGIRPAEALGEAAIEPRAAARSAWSSAC
jgi:putative ABC transport system permease protein